MIKVHALEHNFAMEHKIKQFDNIDLYNEYFKDLQIGHFVLMGSSVRQIVRKCFFFHFNGEEDDSSWKQ